MKKILLLFILFTSFANAQNPVITKWHTNNNFIKINVSGTGSYVLEKEGENTTSLTGSYYNGVNTLSVPAVGLYILKLYPSGSFKFTFDKELTTEDRRKLVELKQWGDVNWHADLSWMFYHCNNLKITATDIPRFSNVTNMKYMFLGCSSIDKIPQIDKWSTGNVIDMTGLFRDTYLFNDSGINAWNTGKVRSMMEMFSNAVNFNQNLNNWDTSMVVTMQSMFSGASSFNGAIDLWNTVNVKEFTTMFINATNFNSSLNTWNTANATSMTRMFENASAFNQNISAWNTDKVEDFTSMFYNASAFNQDISTWNVSNAFYGISGMLRNATSFNQNLGAWTLPRDEYLSFLTNTALSCKNYTLTLKGWSEKTHNSYYYTIGVQNLKYGTEGKIYRDKLLSKGFKFTGDVFDPTCDSTLGAINTNQDNIFRMYPNPSTGRINIFSETTEKGDVLNATGQKIKTIFLIKGDNIIDISSLPSGIYIMKVGQKIQKIMKKD